MDLEQILLLMAIFFFLSIILLVMIFVQRAMLIRRKQLKKRAEDYLIGRYCNNESLSTRVSEKYLVDACVRIADEMILSEEVTQRLFFEFQHSKLVNRYLRQLKSRNLYRKKKAIYVLGHFDTANIRKQLLEVLRSEKRENVKIYLLNALKNKIDQYVLQTVIDSIVGSRRFYQSRVIGILQKHLLSVEAHLQNIFRRPEIEIKEVFVDLANVYYRSEFKPVLLDELALIEAHLSGVEDPTFSLLRKSRVLRLYYGVLTALANIYDTPLGNPKYLAASDPEVVRIATESFRNMVDFESIETLMEYADGTQNDEVRSHTIVKIIENDLNLFSKIIDLLKVTKNPDQKALLAHVLSHKIDYLLLKLLYRDSERLKQLVTLIVEKEFTADLIDFINLNQDKEIEIKLLDLVVPLLDTYPHFKAEMSEFISPRLKHELGLRRQRLGRAAREKTVTEIRKTRWLVGLLVFSLGLAPIAFLVIEGNRLQSLNAFSLLKEYTLQISEWFIIYYMIVNLVYFTLAILSYFGSKKKLRMWEIKSKNFLFEKGMLPSISIIAPAYNEELSIVESVHSLLNLNYPEVEVIVVNDGSKDHTLEKLIDHFQLERKNIHFDSLIKAHPVKAIYRNKAIPSLTVIDKLNGGKADALNVGINFSEGEYICGIDADSILEKDSLLKLMSTMLDHDEITLALGGSIVPVNGYVVDHGQIESRKVSDSVLARLQTIEYMRAFNISRTGFASLKSLLIVSGAFGLFEKRILVEAGGYLTIRSLKKDTVGEDMELVVRVTRIAYENNLNFRIDYINHARCYTQVPEERKSLFRQRNRWQRGLVDILSYHRKMIFNPRYRHAGFIGMPYFFIFEMIGPLFEIQAYLAIFVGLIFGILSIEIVLLLLFVTVVMGILLSLLSIFINEEEITSLTKRDIFVLILYSVFENFGWRQIISIYRVKGFLSSLRETNAWGQMNRIGFKK